MKRRPIIYLAAALLVLAGVLGAAVCLLLRAGAAERLPAVVRIEGVDACINLLRSWPAWGATRAADRPATVLARDGDILLIAGDGGSNMFVPYLASDGTSLTVEAKDARLVAGGVTVSLDLSDSESDWEWVAKATRAELARLRMVGFGKEVKASRVPDLKRLAQANPGIGLRLDDEFTLRRVLPMFHPRWLFLTGFSVIEKEDAATISSRRGLEVLMMDARKIGSLAFLARLPDLRWLHLEDWVPEKTGPFPAGCESLESLSIDAENLASITHLTELRELCLLGDGPPTDMAALSAFPALESLILFFDKDMPDLLPDLSALKGLRGLKRLGLRGKISQEQFAATVRNSPDLRELELVECEGIEDLGPLASLRKLEHLVLIGCKASREPLHKMKNLRLLVLSKDVFEESPEEVRELEAALPHCTVAAGEGVCLGSGWILALLPVVALARVMSRRRRSRRGARLKDA